MDDKSKRRSLTIKRGKTLAFRPALSIFGIPIDKIAVNEDGVPFFMPVIINRLLDNTTQEGIFRIVGNKLTIDQLAKQACSKNFTIEENVTNYDLASFIKQWLRELPTPIITPSVINKYYKDESPKSTKKILRHLATVNRKCIAMIFSLIILISDQSSINMMTLDNLFICILPSIMQTNKDLKVDFKFEPFFNQCIDLLNVDGNDFLL